MRSTWIMVLFFCSRLVAQDNMPYSQFYLSKTMLNPAAAGMTNEINMAAFVRREWTSFPGAPQSNLLVADMPVNYNSMGVGLRVVQESIVANDNWYAHFLYSYKINIAKGKLACGVNVGVMQYNFNASRVAIKDADDRLLAPLYNGKVYPDMGVGLLYTRNAFSIGLSTFNVLKHPNNVFNPEFGNGYTKSNFVLFVSSLWTLSDKWTMENVLLGNRWQKKHTLAAVSVVFGYNDNLFLGWLQRSNSSAAVMVGIRLEKLNASLGNCKLGYSYDINFSETNTYLKNTHEVTLAIRFDKPKSIRKEKQKPQEISPYDL